MAASRDVMSALGTIPEPPYRLFIGLIILLSTDSSLRRPMWKNAFAGCPVRDISSFDGAVPPSSSSSLRVFNTDDSFIHGIKSGRIVISVPCTPRVTSEQTNEFIFFIRSSIWGMFCESSRTQLYSPVKRRFQPTVKDTLFVATLSKCSANPQKTEFFFDLSTWLARPVVTGSRKYLLTLAVVCYSTNDIYHEIYLLIY